MDKIYRYALWVAAVANAATLLTIVLSIVVRLFGTSIPGLDAYAGYFLATTFFLALAETFHRNEHIRVSIILNALTPSKKRYLEIFATFAALFIVGYILFYAGKMVYFSFIFKDISQLPDATPLWIPQIAFVLGMGVFMMSVLERLFRLIFKKDGYE
ncbi:MAG: TRAP transporter small permease [Calditerrivibrio sp.]|nr:TRAP transporter small permease [Calditerrivibrio sp.]